MSKKKPITIYLTMHKDGKRCAFEVDMPGPAKGQTKTKDGKVKYYARRDSARRGALRQIRAKQNFVFGTWEADAGRFGVRRVVFVSR
jgi:hypothetical protein